MVWSSAITILYFESITDHLFKERVKAYAATQNTAQIGPKYSVDLIYHLWNNK